MKISIGKERTFTATVTVKQPNERGGFDTESFKGRFKVIDHDRQRELRSSITEDPDKEVLREAWIGWEGLIDEDTNQPISFSDEIRDALLRNPPVAIAVAQAYFPSLSNGMAKRKN
ncbi:hypothetical protein [Oleomonas cavernae]|uniref:hypothetical protein n=1 Tax=Oleomonas cavernae TaxID=2320859 RepID=UPI001F43F61C|nr:hypothetical protein [Oleomonas cavernae]